MDRPDRSIVIMLIASALRAFLWCGLVPDSSGLADQTNFSFYLLILPWSSIPFSTFYRHLFPSLFFLFHSSSFSFDSYPPPKFRFSFSFVKVQFQSTGKVLKIPSLLMLMPVDSPQEKVKRHSAWPNRNQDGEMYTPRGSEVVRCNEVKISCSPLLTSRTSRCSTRLNYHEWYFVYTVSLLPPIPRSWQSVIQCSIIGTYCSTVVKVCRLKMQLMDYLFRLLYKWIQHVLSF